MSLPDRPKPLTVSRQRAAVELGDCSLDTVDRLVLAGKLEKAQVGRRKVAIKYQSILKLIGEDA